MIFDQQTFCQHYVWLTDIWLAHCLIDRLLPDTMLDRQTFNQCDVWTRNIMPIQYLIDRLFANFIFNWQTFGWCDVWSTEIRSKLCLINIYIVMSFWSTTFWSTQCFVYTVLEQQFGQQFMAEKSRLYCVDQMSVGQMVFDQKLRNHLIRVVVIADVVVFLLKKSFFSDFFTKNFSSNSSFTAHTESAIKVLSSLKGTIL
jgi:hypothetical protein